MVIFFSEPSDTGIIPPQFRKSFHGTTATTATSPTMTNSNVPAVHQSLPPMTPHTNVANNSNSNSNESSPGDGKKAPHQWSSNPVEEWAKEQVCSLFTFQGNAVRLVTFVYNFT